MDKCCFYLNQSLWQTFWDKMLENLPIIILTAALVVATVYLAIYTFKLWKSSLENTEEAKISNQITKESNNVANQANTINIMFNLLKLKSEIENAFINQVKASYIGSFEEVFPLLKDNMTSEEKQEVIKASSMLVHIDPLIEKLKPAYNSLEKSYKNCLDRINQLTQINLEESFSYLFNETLFSRTSLISKLGEISGKYAAKKILINFQLVQLKSMYQEAIKKLNDGYSLDLAKVIIDIMKEIDRLIIDETDILSDGIKEINNFIV